MNYIELVSIENIFAAWDGFKKGKRNKLDVMYFERYLEDELFQLQTELSTQTYVHQLYSQFHVWDPKFRVIHKAEVRDRVVHHLLFNYLEPLFQPSFIRQSYACQKGKGLHLGVEELTGALRTASKNYTRTVWCLKLDIRKFFDSIDHEILLSLLGERVGDVEVFTLLEHVVRSYSSMQRVGKGISIGNLTSQIFSNIYLNELDYFVKNELQERFYFRYADDFILVHPERSHLERLLPLIQEFVAERLQLVVHPNKIILRKFSQGVDFLGYVLLPHYRVLRTKTKQRMFKQMSQRVADFNAGLVDDFGLQQSLQSYLGLLTHCSGYELGERLKNQVWFQRRDNLWP
ncbi:MAG: reverse transcriptase/maturase family protein [Patescibacteria group bacterium]